MLEIDASGANTTRTAGALRRCVGASATVTMLPSGWRNALNPNSASPKPCTMTAAASQRIVREERETDGAAPAATSGVVDAASEASIRAHNLLNERCSLLDADPGLDAASGDAISRPICVATMRC